MKKPTVVARFSPTEKGRKWEYAKLELMAPRGWKAFYEYNWGPSMTFTGGKIKIVLRRKLRKT